MEPIAAEIVISDEQIVSIEATSRGLLIVVNDLYGAQSLRSADRGYVLPGDVRGETSVSARLRSSTALRMRRLTPFRLNDLLRRRGVRLSLPSREWRTLYEAAR